MSEEARTAGAALLRFLLQHRLVTPEAVQIARAEGEGKDNPEGIIDHLVLKGDVSEEAIALALSKHLRLPFIDLAACSVDPNVTRLVKEDVANRHKLVALNLDNDRLVVATSNPLNREGLRTL